MEEDDTYPSISLTYLGAGQGTESIGEHWPYSDRAARLSIRVRIPARRDVSRTILITIGVPRYARDDTFDSRDIIRLGIPVRYDRLRVAASKLPPTLVAFASIPVAGLHFAHSRLGPRQASEVQSVSLIATRRVHTGRDTLLRNVT